MVLPSYYDLLSMDFCLDGYPYVNVVAVNTIDLDGMDYCLDAYPWYGAEIRSWYEIIPELSINFLRIASDSRTSLDSGFLYLTTSTGFYVIDLESNSIYDMYTTSCSGRAKEALIDDSIVDSSVI